MINTQAMQDFQKSFFGANTMSSPFELRFKILEMAKEYLDNSYQLQYDLAQKNLELMQEQGKLTIETYKKMMPENYTMQDVIAKAQELYGFVESKDGKKTK